MSTAQDTPPAVRYHWVFTLQWLVPSGTSANTVSGTLATASASRSATWDAALAAARRTAGLDDRQRAVVLFSSLEPEDLAAP